MKPASDDPAGHREESQRGINVMDPGQLNRVGARQKEVASHLDNARLMRAVPQSPNPNNRNAVFDDGSVKRPDPGSKNRYMVTSLGEGPRDLLAGGCRSSADRRVFVVNEQKSHAKTQRKSSNRTRIRFRDNYGLQPHQ